MHVRARVRASERARSLFCIYVNTIFQTAQGRLRGGAAGHALSDQKSFRLISRGLAGLPESNTCMLIDGGQHVTDSYEEHV